MLGYFNPPTMSAEAELEGGGECLFVSPGKGVHDPELVRTGHHLCAVSLLQGHRYGGSSLRGTVTDLNISPEVRKWSVVR